MGAGLAMTKHLHAGPGRSALGRALRGASALLAFTALVGCSSGQEGGNTILNVGRTVAGSVIAQRTDDGGGVTATDATLRNFNAPLLVLTDLKENRDAVIGIVSDRDGNVIWKSADNLTITLRDGMMVASRGFGEDLMSADVPKVRGGTGEVVRDHYYLGGDELITRSRFFCDLSSPGSERIIVTGVASTARVVVEDCRGEGETFENRYWIEPGGLIRKSIQWMSPSRGSFEIEVVPQGRASNVAMRPETAAVTISE